MMGSRLTSWDSGIKRLVLSVIGGFGIPFLYSVITGPLSLYIESERIRHLLWIPIGWPRMIFYYFYFSTPLFKTRINLDNTALFILQIALNVMLYGFLTFFMLLWRSSRKRRVQLEPPPPAQP